MLKKITLITSSVVIGYSSQAMENFEAIEKQFTRVCSGSPTLPTDKEMKDHFKSQITTIITYCFELTPEEKKTEFEDARQETWQIAMQLSDILFPTLSKNEISFTQLDREEQSKRHIFKNTLIDDLMKINDIRGQHNYLKAVTSNINLHIDPNQNQAGYQYEEQQNKFRKICTGSPNLPTDREMKDEFLSRITTIVQCCFEWTLEKNLEKFELMRQEAWGNALRLGDILFPITSKNGLSFTQLNRYEQENRLDFKEAVIKDLMTMKNIQFQWAYLKGITSTVNAQNQQIDHQSFKNILASNLKKINNIHREWAYMKGVLSIKNSQINLNQNPNLQNSLLEEKDVIIDITDNEFFSNIIDL